MNTEVGLIQVREIKHGTIELRTDNILAFRPEVSTFKEYNMDVLKDLLQEFIDITDGVPRPYLCDNRYITGIVSKEEQAYINEHFGKFATRAAMITHSNLIRVLLNNYNTFFKPKVELRLFKSEKAAVEWLLNKATANVD